ncbi:MAG: NAD(P)/FAD-dependent oxidoreductase [Granulosicoccus sp.]
MTKVSESSDVVIVGAGITGLSSAVSLAEQGARVTVVDRYQPASMASGWTLAGVRQSGRDPAELFLAQRAVTLWQTLAEKLGAPTGYQQTGNVRLARTEAEAIIIEQLVEQQQAAGLEITLLKPSEIQQRIPALANTLHCASLCLSDGQADPLLTSLAYRQAAEHLGVRFQLQTAVNKVHTRAGRFQSLACSTGELSADHCILATGIQTNELLDTLNVSIPLQWARVTVMLSEPQPPMLKPVIGVANADLAVRQQSDGCLRMTSGAQYTDATLTENEGNPHVPISRDVVKETLNRIANVLPAVTDVTLAKSWGGLLDMTPDALPVIDQVSGIDKLTVVAGFSGHGFGIGPAVGEAVAELVLHNTRNQGIAGFTIDRFTQTVQPAPELHG